MAKNLILKRLIGMTLIITLLFAFNVHTPVSAASSLSYAYMVNYNQRADLESNGETIALSVKYKGNNAKSTQKMITTNTVGNAYVHYGQEWTAGVDFDSAYVSVSGGFDGQLSVVDTALNDLYSDTLVLTASYNFLTEQYVASMYTGFTNSKWGHIIRFTDGKAIAFGKKVITDDITINQWYNVGVVISHLYQTVSYNINGSVTTYTFSELGLDSTYKVNNLRPIYVDGASDRSVNYYIRNFGVKQIPSNNTAFGKADSEFLAYNIYGALLSNDLVCSETGITCSTPTYRTSFKTIVENDGSSFYGTVGYRLLSSGSTGMKDDVELNDGDSVIFDWSGSNVELTLTPVFVWFYGNLSSGQIQNLSAYTKTPHFVSYLRCFVDLKSSTGEIKETLYIPIKNIVSKVYSFGDISFMQTPVKGDTINVRIYNFGNSFLKPMSFVRTFRVN